MLCVDEHQTRPVGRVWCQTPTVQFTGPAPYSPMRTSSLPPTFQPPTPPTLLSLPNPSITSTHTCLPVSICPLPRNNHSHVHPDCCSPHPLAPTPASPSPTPSDKGVASLPIASHKLDQVGRRASSRKRGLDEAPVVAGGPGCMLRNLGEFMCVCAVSNLSDCVRWLWWCGV